MDDVQKMFQTIINGQSAMKGELLGEINKFRKETNQRFDEMDKKMDKVEKKLTKRLDMIGGQLADLDDDAPTKEEFEKLEKRVGNLEMQVAAV